MDISGGNTNKNPTSRSTCSNNVAKVKLEFLNTCLRSQVGEYKLKSLLIKQAHNVLSKIKVYEERNRGGDLVILL
jgi:hypothetical protein